MSCHRWASRHRNATRHPAPSRTFAFRPWAEVLEGRDAPAAGSLDPTFGTDGIVSFSFSFTDALNDIALQSDGKIVAGGSTQVTGQDQDFALARFNPDGTLDTSFGVGGRVRTDFGPNFRDSVQALAVLPDDKILAAGNIGGTATVGLARYNPDGTLDTTFGSSGTGRVAVDFSLTGFETAFDLAVLPDGRFVVSGGVQPNPTQSKSLFAVARFLADGSLDATFGTGGVATTDFGPTDAGAFGVVVQSDGKVVGAGQSSSSGGNFSFAVARYNADGTPDTSFAGTGRLQFGFGAGTSTPTGRDVALQADGKIVVGGIFFNNNNGTSDIGVARLNPDGTFDATFSSDGLATVHTGSNEDGHAIAVQDNGKIVVAGLRTQPGGSNSFITRLNPDGSLDAGFGSGEASSPTWPLATTTSSTPSSSNRTARSWRRAPQGGSIRNFGIVRYEEQPAAVGLGRQRVINA